MSKKKINYTRLSKRFASCFFEIKKILCIYVYTLFLGEAVVGDGGKHRGRRVDEA